MQVLPGEPGDRHLTLTETREQGDFRRSEASEVDFTTNGDNQGGEGEV